MIERPYLEIEPLLEAEVDVGYGGIILERGGFPVERSKVERLSLAPE